MFGVDMSLNYALTLTALYQLNDTASFLKILFSDNGAISGL